MSNHRIEAKLDAFVELFCLALGEEQEDVDGLYRMWEERVEDMKAERAKERVREVSE